MGRLGKEASNIHLYFNMQGKIAGGSFLGTEIRQKKQERPLIGTVTSFLKEYVVNVSFSHQEAAGSYTKTECAQLDEIAELARFASALGRDLADNTHLDYLSEREQEGLKSIFLEPTGDNFRTDKQKGELIHHLLVLKASNDEWPNTSRLHLIYEIFPRLDELGISLESACRSSNVDIDELDGFIKGQRKSVSVDSLRKLNSFLKGVRIR